MKKILFSLVATIMLCVVGNAQNLRLKFLSNKTNEQITAEFIKLTSQEQNVLWIEKMDQLLLENLPKEHKLIISKFKDFFKTVNKPEDIVTFVDLSVKISEITPLEDLKYMFSSLSDYKFQGKFIGKSIVTKDVFNSLESLSSSDNIALLSRGNCSCRWCVGTGNTGRNCDSTSSGCGWFFLQSCNQCIVCL